jgi:hypothetical protein
LTDAKISTEKIAPVLLDEILNELKQIRRALTGDGKVVPMVITLNPGEIKVVNDQPTELYRDVDIVNRGPGTLFVTLELLQDGKKIFRSQEIEILPDEADSLNFNEPRIGKVILRADGGTRVKIVFSS